MLTKKKFFLEVACFNLDSALIAIKAGVDRIEYCADFVAGGITPLKDEVAFLKSQTDIPIFVMIRPRGGDFCYSNDEFKLMKAQLLEFKDLNVDGFVFGILNKDFEVNIEQNQQLVNLAYPKSCTFHRAFDRVKNLNESLEKVIACGFSTVLTSGCDTNALNGLESLKILNQLANNRLSIMPGGGVRSTNLKGLMVLKSNFYHTSGILPAEDIANLTEILNCLKILNEA